MNYALHYSKLIERAKTRTLVGYCERHHVIPRCMGGDNDKSNLVRLAAEEHFIAHQLLVKIFPDNHKLVFALHRLTHVSENCARNNKMYGWIKRKFSESMKGNKYGSALKGYKHSVESIANMSKAKIGNKFGTGRIGNNKEGAVLSEETKLKISTAMRGKKNALGSKRSSEVVAGIRQRMLGNKQNVGFKHSRLMKNKMSILMAGNKIWLGRKHSEESKLKMSESRKRRSSKC